jgi:protein-L-isoaspartate O-methyltransferase
MTTTTENTWQEHAAHLATQLTDAGDIHDSAWARAIAETPRHLLVPTAYLQQPDGAWRQLNNDLGVIYSPTTLVTALADGQAISSSTKPDLMVRMLETLGVRDGDRVLEIGTGSGYNAALLAHRLGADQVYSVDLDAELVDPARERLASFGVHPHLATRNGATGWPEHALYDRIIATCSVPRTPWAWADQLTHDGQLLADLKLAPGAGNLVLLRGFPGRLESRFTSRWAAFMDLRQPARAPASKPCQPRESVSRRWTTNVPADTWNTHREAWMLASLNLPTDLRRGYRFHSETHEPSASTLSGSDGSWCGVDMATRQVQQGGMTPLWEHVERAYARWTGWGAPGWERFGLTVRAERQTIWLDTPAKIVTELL